MDVTHSLQRDHRALEKLFQSFQRIRRERDGQQRRQELLLEMTRTLSAHAAAEEQVVYPVVAKELPDGARLAASALKEHQAAKEALEALGRTSVDDDEFDRRLGAIILDVRHHVEKEEGEIFEKLRGWLGKQRLKALGGAVEAAQYFAPTRPHSMMPNKPPFNTFAAPATAVVDRMLDAADEGRAKVRQAAQAAFGTLREAVDGSASEVRRQAERAADRVEAAVQAGRRGATRLSRRGTANPTSARRRDRTKARKSSSAAGRVRARRSTKKGRVSGKHRRAAAR
jgi:hemerythrin superfamily protein